jgi:outer membrane protein
MRSRALAAFLVGSLVCAAAPARSLEPAEPAEPLTFAEALRLAAEGNETPAIAAARLERSQAFRRQAIAALAPSLTITGAYTRRPREVTRTIDGDEVTVQAIDALSSQATAESILLDLRALPLLRAATRAVEAQELESAELGRELAYDVANGFFTVLSAELLEGAVQQRVEVAEATVEEARLRLEAGLAGRNDVTRSELELATARLDRTRAAQGVVSARLALGYLINAPVERRPLAQPEPPPAPEADLAAAVGRALEQRYDLRALERRAEQARQLALEPRYRVLPRFDLRGIYRWTNESGLSGNDADWNATVGMTWELFDGGDRQAVAAQREADLREAELTLAASRRAVEREVADALSGLETAASAVVQAEVRLEVARANAVEVRERFLNGLATALEQADAQVEQFEAEAELVRQRYVRVLARLALDRAVGGWPEPDPQAGTGRAAGTAPPAAP